MVFETSGSSYTRYHSSKLFSLLMITWLLRGNRLWDSCAFTVSRILLRVWLPQIYRSLSSLSRYLQIEVHALWKERFHWAPSNKGRIYIKRRGAPFPNRPLSSKRPIFK